MSTTTLARPSKRGRPLRVCPDTGGDINAASFWEALMARLWKRVDRRGPDECWLWLGFTDRYGYGSMHVAAESRPSSAKVHRLVWESVNGPIPDGYTIDHACHNDDVKCHEGNDCTHRRCCNPAHLRLLSRSDNARLGRKRCLSHPDRQRVFDLRWAGWSYTQIASATGYTRRHVIRICHASQ